MVDKNLSTDETVFMAKFRMEEIKIFEKIDTIKFLDRYGKLRLTYIKEEKNNE